MFSMLSLYITIVYLAKRLLFFFGFYCRKLTRTFQEDNEVSFMVSMQCALLPSPVLCGDFL